jgi:hypothetical protein
MIQQITQILVDNSANFPAHGGSYFSRLPMFAFERREMLQYADRLSSHTGHPPLPNAASGA